MLENIELRKWLMFLALIALTWVAIKVNGVLFGQMRKKKNELKLKFFERFNVGVILIVAVITAFSIFGALGELWKTLLGGTAVITAVLAFTAQDIIKDILAGFMISIYKPFEIGNRIELENGTCGIVKDITMRHVALSLLDNTVCV
ncbi:MAG: mechanosensitive ion channel, partial [Solobacterium sp.]|nr:mechanosensitive ion channel [Solobacterium sp.]